MSKSDPSDFSRILLTDADDVIASKIKKAKSDSDLIPSSPEDLQNKPECLNLINILSACLGKDANETLQEYSEKTYSSLKSDLSENLIQIISPIRNEIKKLLDNRDELDKILSDGAQKASSIANPVINEVYRIIGFK